MSEYSQDGRRKWAAAAPEKSGFSQTCNLLRQFLKGKGSLKDVSPQIATQLEGGKGSFSDCYYKKEIKMTQMTIFYDGKVTVFDISPEKANHLLTTLAAAHQRLTTTPHPSAAASDLPLARRTSLHRFLDKRKARVVAKGPYHINFKY